MSHRGKAKASGRCARCCIIHARCICLAIPHIPTHTRFVIVRHAQERNKSSNTARIAALALPNCTLVDYGLRGAPFQEAVVMGPGTQLLYPDGGLPQEASTPPSTLVVLDGSWSQARHMGQQIVTLQTMPRFSLPRPAQAQLRLKRVLLEDGMSTLEAMAYAVMRLEGEEPGLALLRLHALFVSTVLSTKM